jgi:hypothetical protein
MLPLLDEGVGSELESRKPIETMYRLHPNEKFEDTHAAAGTFAALVRWVLVAQIVAAPVPVMSTT